jgi:hypothetical protein
MLRKLLGSALLFLFLSSLPVPRTAVARSDKRAAQAHYKARTLPTPREGGVLARGPQAGKVTARSRSAGLFKVPLRYMSAAAATARLRIAGLPRGVESVVPASGDNALIVSGSRAGSARIQEMAWRIDLLAAPMPLGVVQTELRVEYREAEWMAERLKGQGGIISVTPFNTGRSVVVRGTVGAIKALQEDLFGLDVPVRPLGRKVAPLVFLADEGGDGGPCVFVAYLEPEIVEAAWQRLRSDQQERGRRSADSDVDGSSGGTPSDVVIVRKESETSRSSTVGRASAPNSDSADARSWRVDGWRSGSTDRVAWFAVPRGIVSAMLKELGRLTAPDGRVAPGFTARAISVGQRSIADVADRAARVELKASPYGDPGYAQQTIPGIVSTAYTGRTTRPGFVIITGTPRAVLQFEENVRVIDSNLPYP